MADEGFFSRWSRRKAESLNKETPPAVANDEARDPAQPVADRAPDTPPAAAEAKPQPTMEDVARLTKDSDYSAFLARGVDENVKRSALKKLFSDPHFNVMDGLDVYIEDYNKFEPIPPAMLAALAHAKSTLNPLSQLEKPLMRALDSSENAEQPRDGKQASDAVEEPAADETTESTDAAQAHAQAQPEPEPEEQSTEQDTAAPEKPIDQETPPRARS